MDDSSLFFRVSGGKSIMSRIEELPVTEEIKKILRYYSMMQSDGNSLKIDTFRETITSALVISS